MAQQCMWKKREKFAVISTLSIFALALIISISEVNLKEYVNLLDTETDIRLSVYNPFARNPKMQGRKNVFIYRTFGFEVLCLRDFFISIFEQNSDC